MHSTSFDHPIYAQADAWLARSRPSVEASLTFFKEITNNLADEDSVGRTPMAAPMSPEEVETVLEESKEVSLNLHEAGAATVGKSTDDFSPTHKLVCSSTLTPMAATVSKRVAPPPPPPGSPPVLCTCGVHPVHAQMDARLGRSKSSEEAPPPPPPFSPPPIFSKQNIIDLTF
jgi:hypothetical protein